MRVLIAYDGGDAGERALSALRPWLADTGAEIHLATIIEPKAVHETPRPAGVHGFTPAATASGQLLHTHEPVAGFAEDRSQALAGMVAERRDRLQAVAARLLPGLSVHTHAELSTETADALIAIAVRIEAAIIVVGSHGRGGIQRAVLGSVSEGLIRRAPVPVLVMGPRVAGPPPL